MHHESFISDLAIIMLIAGIVTILFRRFNQPVVLGYIIAGVILGPHTPPFNFIQDEKIINTLAELGVIFLMFSLGLEFNLKKFKRVGPTAIVAALTEIIVMIFIGYEIGSFFKWQTMDSLFLGGMLAISSTTIIVKTINELKLQKEHFVQLVYGILIIEDILAVGLLVLLSSIAISGTINLVEVSTTIGKLSLFLVMSLLLGILIVPKLLAFVAKFKSQEMLLITVLALCFGSCLLVIKFNYSIVLGAFIIGTIIAESRQLKIIEKIIKPLRNMFSAIFFVSVGLLLDPNVLVTYAMPIMIITLGVILGKVVTCSIGTFITGNDGPTSLRVGMGLAQIGEFSFIIAALGTNLKVTSGFLYSIAVAVSAVTTLLTPYLIKCSNPVSASITSIMPQKLIDIANLYTDWLKNIVNKDQIALKRAIKQGLIRVVINLMIVTAIFLGGAYVATHETVNFINKIANEDIKKMLIWGASLILSLPFLIAVYQKLNGLSMVLAELKVKDQAVGRYTIAVRKVISEVIPIISIIAILLLTSLLSASILPRIELILLMLFIALVLVIFLWRWLVRLHIKLQSSLIETLKMNNDKS
jgi:CPA2 family monovalent cation:H+ antiporter-2